MNDITAILAGYTHAPHLLIDGLRWWHGPWIQEGIQVYRPISSYLLWIESWIGLHWGFIWVGWIGLVQFGVDCCLATALGLRLTCSRLCALLAAVLAPAILTWNWGGAQPAHWLIWFPCHSDLLMIGCLLGAAIA